MPGTEYFKKSAKHTLKPRWGGAITVVTVGFCVTILLMMAEQLTDMLLGFTLTEQTLIESGNLRAFYMEMFGQPLKAALYFGVSALFLLLGIIVRAPISLGIKRYFWGVTAGGPETAGTAFDFFASFKMYFRAVRMELYIFARILLRAIILLIPGTALIWLSAYAGDYQVLALLFGYLAYIGAAAVMIPEALKYYMAGYILANDDEISPSGAIKKSIKMTKGTKGSYFILMLSFIGWWLLCIFILPMMYVMPYTGAANAHYAHYVMREYAKKNAAENGRTQIIVY
ncbi:MAG TPA: hypothetical protein DEQ02_09525 [Ruminococcaceae bacterium]|nr:hypothetical protein [Oscillospiraceae bacterium]